MLVTLPNMHTLPSYPDTPSRPTPCRVYHHCTTTTLPPHTPRHTHPQRRPGDPADDPQVFSALWRGFLLGLGQHDGVGTLSPEELRLLRHAPWTICLEQVPERSISLCTAHCPLPTVIYVPYPTLPSPLPRPFRSPLTPNPQGIRFLHDALLGDVYYKVQRPYHNIHRARVQLELVRQLELHAAFIDSLV